MLLLAVPPPVFADELSAELLKSTRDILDEGGTDLSDTARWRFSDLCDTVGAWAAEGLQPALHLAAQSAGYLLLAGLLLAARSDYIEVNGRRYPRTPVALSEQPVSDGGGYHALWGAAEERGRGHEAMDVAEAAVAQSAKAG